MSVPHDLFEHTVAGTPPVAEKGLQVRAGIATFEAKPRFETPHPDTRLARAQAGLIGRHDFGNGRPNQVL
jgi:hypothetical protein